MPTVQGGMKKWYRQWKYSKNYVTFDYESYSNYFYVVIISWLKNIFAVISSISQVLCCFSFIQFFTKIINIQHYLSEDNGKLSGVVVVVGVELGICTKQAVASDCILLSMYNFRMSTLILLLCYTYFKGSISFVNLISKFLILISHGRAH